jgi:DNA-binding transcriptional LysR family regulator
VTPTQLRAFAAVVRLGSVKEAAAELGVSEAAVSLHVGQLRKELDDKLFSRTASGLAFTPGGLRLASRAGEMLGLQDRTILEVSQAAHGRRMLRVAASSLFAEHAAPGLLELFTARADDLDVELSVAPPEQFGTLLATRTVDVAIGPHPDPLPAGLADKVFLQYEVQLVAAPSHPCARIQARPAQLREQIWLLGPSAVGSGGAMPALLQRFEVPESNQRIFQSHVAALDEAKRGGGVAPAISFAVTADLANGTLVRVGPPTAQARGMWAALTLAGNHIAPAAAELIRFATTPRATHAMIRGAGVTIGRFRPSVHVTLWS